MTPVPVFELDDDGTVSFADREIWVREIKGTYLGDTNLDGKFNNADLVEAFATGKYETAQDAGWSDSDWNGDGVFGSGDLVTAFQDGGYEHVPRAAVVPEPSAFLLAIFVAMSLAIAFPRGGFLERHCE